MPTAPDITVTASPVFLPRFMGIAYINFGVGDHNELWRQTPSEYGGQFIKISDTLTWTTFGGTFTDYNVASGKVYTYYAVAVDASGVTAPSITQSGTVTLQNGGMHAVSKTDPTTNGPIVNLTGDIEAPMLDMIPHNRQYGLGSTTYLLGNASTPTIGIGNIEDIGVGLTNRIPNTAAYSATRQTIRDIYESRRYVCMRDTRGNKFFGQLVYSEQYQATFTDLSIGFLVRDFTEAL